MSLGAGFSKNVQDAGVWIETARANHSRAQPILVVEAPRERGASGRCDTPASIRRRHQGRKKRPSDPRMHLSIKAD
jgi:hypothetical protein